MRKLLTVAVILVAAFYMAEFVVYTYDSMVSGLGKILVKMFEKEYGVKVKMVSFGDAGSMLSRVLLEGKSTKADVILGLDQNLLIRAKEKGLLFPYKPKGIKNVRKDLLDEEFYATPYDYGAIAVVYNKDTVKVPPKSLKDLLSKRYRRRIVVEDPRTSSTGLSFLLWTIGVFGEDYLNYWKELKDNLLTITAGWDEAFEMLENGEADMMVSYITDAAYSKYYYGTVKYIPAVFEDGMYVQIEYVGICRFTDDLELSKKFVEFMISPEVQKEIPLNQWMLPVTPVDLPEVFKRYVPKVEKIVRMDSEYVEKNIERWLKDWERAIR